MNGNNYSNMPPPACGADKTPNAVYPMASNTSGVGFEDNTVRRLFIRKVYSILTIQLLFTAGIIAVFQAVEPINEYVSVQRQWWPAVLSGVVFIITYFLLVCPCFSFKRKHPANIILLVILTIALSVTAGILATFYSTKIVVMAFGTTSAVVLIVTLLTFWSKFDITKFWYIVLIAPIGMLIIWPFMFIFPGIKILSLVYAGIGVVCFTIYLAFDTKMIMGGGRLEMSPDEYIVAVVQLYVDIVQIFMYFLQIFGLSSD